jgi:hypothetical protein
MRSKLDADRFTESLHMPPVTKERRAASLFEHCGSPFSQ